MKFIKICPYCKAEFTTEERARKFCKKRCAFYSRHKSQKSKVRQSCQWCGQIFSHDRAKKFCCDGCRQEYMTRYAVVHHKITKIPVKVTLTEAARKSKEEGVSYGTFVTHHQIW